MATPWIAKNSPTRLLQRLCEHAPGYSLGIMHSGCAADFRHSARPLAFGLAHARQSPVLVVDAAACLDEALPTNSDATLAGLLLGTSSESDVLDDCVAPGVYFLPHGDTLSASLSDCEHQLRELVEASEARQVICLIAAGDISSTKVITFARPSSANVILHSLTASSQDQLQDALRRLNLAGVAGLACVLTTCDASSAA